LNALDSRPCFSLTLPFFVVSSPGCVVIFFYLGVLIFSGFHGKPRAHFASVYLAVIILACLPSGPGFTVRDLTIGWARGSFNLATLALGVW
jgi:hypothetical protein